MGWPGVKAKTVWAREWKSEEEKKGGHELGRGGEGRRRRRRRWGMGRVGVQIMIIKKRLRGNCHGDAVPRAFEMPVMRSRRMRRVCWVFL